MWWVLRYIDWTIMAKFESSPFPALPVLRILIWCNLFDAFSVIWFFSQEWVDWWMCRRVVVKHSINPNEAMKQPLTENTHHVDLYQKYVMPSKKFIMTLKSSSWSRSYVTVADPRGGGVNEVPAHGKIAFICWRIVSNFVWLDLSPKDDQNRGEDTNPPKQPITIQWIS